MQKQINNYFDDEKRRFINPKVDYEKIVTKVFIMSTMRIPYVRCVVCKGSQPFNVTRTCDRCKLNPLCLKCAIESFDHGNFCANCFNKLPENDRKLVLRQHQTIRKMEKSAKLYLLIGIIGWLPAYIITSVILNLVPGYFIGKDLIAYLPMFIFVGILLYGLYQYSLIHPNKRRHLPLPSEMK
jgi:hypothetical protein